MSFRRFIEFFVALALVVVSLHPTFATAQTIRGTVTSGGTAIVGANVRIPDFDRAQRTGSGGEFAFTDMPAGTHTLFVTARGYALASKSVVSNGASITITFDLKPSALPLKEIVVSATPVARSTDDQYQATASKSLLDFQNSGGMSFAERIADLPGVAARSNGSAPARPILRGLGDNEVLVLENGLRMGDIATYDPAHATPLMAMGIAQVDVVRGPATILYGPSTIGGIVNVMTEIVPTISSRPVSGTVSLEGNSVNDGYTGHFRNVFSNRNQAFSISGGLLRAGETRIPSGLYIDPGSEKAFTLDRMPQTFDQSNEAGLGYTVQGGLGTFGIGAKYFDANYGIPGVPPNPDFAHVPPTTSRISQQRRTIETRSVFSVASAFIRQLKLDANYNDYTHSEFPTAQDVSGVSDTQANHFHKRAFNAVLELQQQPIGKWQGTLGLWTNIENLTIAGDEPLGPNSVTTGVAAYAFEEYLPSATTRLQAGVRFDYNKIQTNPFAQSTDPVFQTLNVSRLHNAFTASLGAIRQFTPEVTGSVNLARSFRAPTVQELFANGLDAASGTFSIGTASLGPETGFGVDASLKGTFEHATFELSPYVNYINNYIFGFLRGDTIDDFPVRQFASTNARLMGFEASAALAATSTINIRASADYVNAQDTKLNEPLPFIPPLRALVRATFQDSRWMGLLELRGAASQTRLGEGDTPTGAYTVMNLGAGVRFVRQGMVHNLSIRCDNLFNTVYRDNLSVVKDFLPQPARGFRVNYQLLY